MLSLLAVFTLSPFAVMPSAALEQALKLAEEGSAALALGDANAAVSLLNRAIYLQPDDPRFLVTRAEALLQLCDFQSAAANLRRALNLSKAAAAASGGAATGSSRSHAVRLAAVLDLRAVSLIEAGAPPKSTVLLDEAISLGGQRRLRLHRALAHGARQPGARWAI